MDGTEVLYYVETETAFKLKIDSRVDFAQKHPQYGNFHLITIPIDKISSAFVIDVSKFFV